MKKSKYLLICLCCSFFIYLSYCVIGAVVTAEPIENLEQVVSEPIDGDLIETMSLSDGSFDGVVFPYSVTYVSTQDYLCILMSTEPILAHDTKLFIVKGDYKIIAFKSGTGNGGRNEGSGTSLNYAPLQTAFDNYKTYKKIIKSSSDIINQTNATIIFDVNGKGIIEKNFEDYTISELFLMLIFLFLIVHFIKSIFFSRGVY